MADMNIRNMSDTLLVLLKSHALQERVTLREYVIRVLGEAIGVREEGGGRVSPTVAGGECPVVERVLVEDPEEPTTEDGSPFGEARSVSEGPSLKVKAEAEKQRLVEHVSRTHNPKECRMYRCGQCEVLGVKDKHRGLE
jgi:hypothetical protein